MVTVPRREVDGKLQPILATGVGQFADDVALAVLPRRVLYRIVSIGRRPHTEAAVVLGGEDDALHAGVLAGAHPLSAVELRRIEEFHILVAVAPLLVGISVQRIVDEGIHLHIL